MRYKDVIDLFLYSFIFLGENGRDNCRINKKIHLNPKCLMKYVSKKVCWLYELPRKIEDDCYPIEIENRDGMSLSKSWNY